MLHKLLPAEQKVELPTIIKFKIIEYCLQLYYLWQHEIVHLLCISDGYLVLAQQIWTMTTSVLLKMSMLSCRFLIVFIASTSWVMLAVGLIGVLEAGVSTLIKGLVTCMTNHHPCTSWWSSASLGSSWPLKLLCVCCNLHIYSIRCRAISSLIPSIEQSFCNRTRL